jgi:hypothetical protein
MCARRLAQVQVRGAVDDHSVDAGDAKPDHKAAVLDYLLPLVPALGAGRSSLRSESVNLEMRRSI